MPANNRQSGPLSLELVARYGVPGEPIPGSRFVRDYCVRCRAPIRVPMGNVGKQTCSDCFEQVRDTVHERYIGEV